MTVLIACTTLHTSKPYYSLQKQFEKPIETDEDLVLKNMDPYIPAGTSIGEAFFQNSASLAKRKLYDRVVKKNTYFVVTEKIGPPDEKMIREG